MVHYYFHLRNGHDILPDPEGRELASLDAVRSATMTEARAIISNDALQGCIKLSYHLDVEDAAGLVVYTLQFEDAVEVVRGSRKSPVAEPRPTTRHES